MPAAQRDGSDRIGTEHGTDISELAEEFAIDPDMLEAALGDADRLLRMSWENIHTADKRALRGTTKALAELIDRLSSDALRERLIEAVVQVPNGPDDEELAKYEAWWAAQDRVDRAIAGAQDLLAIVRAGEALRLPTGRRGYLHWTVAISSLLDFWVCILGRKVTISGHTSDPRGVKPSRTVRFVRQCMRLLGEDITEQACRTILKKLRNQEAQ